MRRLGTAAGVLLAIALAGVVSYVAWAPQGSFGFLEGHEPIRTTREMAVYSFQGDFQDIARMARGELAREGYLIDPRGHSAPNAVYAEKASGAGFSTVSVYKDTRPGDTMIASVLAPSSVPPPTHSRTEMLMIGKSPGWVYVRLEKVETPSFWQRFRRVFGL